MTGAPSLDERLQALEPLFAGRPANTPPPSLRPLLDSLSGVWNSLSSPQRQVTFLGRTQTGKSSLLNALIGAPVLPVRVNRGTGAVTALRFAERAAAAIVRPNGREDPLAWNALAGTVLLDLARGVPADGDIDHVRIELPLPLLPPHVNLVDTPGIWEDERVTERVHRELERTDLAVVVLAADQILSARDRQVAHHLHELLNGNVAYVVNRLDLIDPEDQEEVLGWVRQALRGTGNAVIGEAPVFATAAPPGRLGEVDPNYDPAVLRTWLGELLVSERGAQVAALARLGLLRRLLTLLSAATQTELAAAHRDTAGAEAEAEERVAKERAEIRERLALARAQLGGRAVLGPLGEAFVNRCVEDTRQYREANQSAAIHVQVDGALDAFAAGVSEHVQTLVLDLPVTAPPFDLKSWIMRAEVTAARHPTSDAGALFGGLLTQVIDGGSAGRAVGESLGGWVGKHVFGVDVEAETLKRVTGAARGVAQSLQAEAESYFARIDDLLRAADDYYSSWTPGSPWLTEVRDRERSLGEIAAWCQKFEREVSTLSAELTAER